MTLADINTKIAAAVTAQEAGDYATALTYLRSARMLLIATPDSQGPTGTGLRFDRASIDAMIRDLERAQGAAASASAGGIRRTKVIYKRAGAEDCD